VAAWELVSARAAGAALARSEEAWLGGASLRVEVPPGRGSVTIGTPQIRGWMLEEFGVRAIRFVAKTTRNPGSLKLALHVGTGTDRMAVHGATREWEVGSTWTRVELALEDLPRLDPRGVDWFSIQFRAESGTSLLLDELELVVR
ncbi:MAG: hypothetical protein IT580_05190, partial [Verrucomicrobiales bacterium]|nr:hypothetical protein [Verrucomicrobiales bacterium]